MEQYIDNARFIQMIDNAFITKDDFRGLCYGLEITPDKMLRLSEKSDRNYLALREWTKRVRSVDNFIQALTKMGQHALIRELNVFGMRSGPSQTNPRPTFGELRVMIFSELTNDDRKAILLGIGFPAGRADSSSRGIADFWSALSNQGKFTEQNIMMDVWREFPNIQAMISSYTGYSAVPSKPIACSTTALPANRSDMALNNPFMLEEVVENLTAFVASDSAFYLKLCMVMNEHMCWKDLLRIYGLLNSPAAAKMVLDLSHDWELRKNNPTDHVLKLLSPTKHGQKSLDEFSSDLSRIDCSDLQQVVAEWNAFRSAQTTKAIDANTSVFVANTNLRQFLLKHISTKETVDKHIEMLTAPAIGVQEPEDLMDMTSEQFQLAGFSAVQINKFVKAIRSASSSTSALD